MTLFASFNIIHCPKCGAAVIARGIYPSKAEPELNVATCGKCGLELQIIEDKATGKTRVERVKKN